MLAIVNMILLLVGFLVRLRKEKRIPSFQRKLDLPAKQVAEPQKG